MAKSPTATQSLTPKDQVIRRAQCPLSFHRMSSDYLGVQEYEGKTVWVFRCREGHRFYASPDPHAPKLGEEQDWIRDQKGKRIQARERKRQ